MRPVIVDDGAGRPGPGGAGLRGCRRERRGRGEDQDEGDGEAPAQALRAAKRRVGCGALRLGDPGSAWSGGCGLAWSGAVLGRSGSGGVVVPAGLQG